LLSPPIRLGSDWKKGFVNKSVVRCRVEHKVKIYVTRWPHGKARHLRNRIYAVYFLIRLTGYMLFIF